jgi:hypothetical protein
MAKKQMNIEFRKNALFGARPANAIHHDGRTALTKCGYRGDRPVVLEEKDPHIYVSAKRTHRFPGKYLM